MRYHFGYGVGHVYGHGHAVWQPAAEAIPPDPPASHASDTPPAAAARLDLEQLTQNMAQDHDVSLEAESSSENSDSIDLDDEDDDDGAEVDEDLDFRNPDDIEELLVEEMYTA